jgi:hypothetical protein
MMWQGVLAIPEHKQGFSTVDSHHKRVPHHWFTTGRTKSGPGRWLILPPRKKPKTAPERTSVGRFSLSNKKLASNYRVILTLTSGSLKSNNCQKNLPWTAGSLNLRKKPRTDGYVIPNLNIKKTWNPVSFKLWKLKFRKPGTLGSLILIFFQKAGTSSYNKSKNCPMMNRHQSGYESRVTAKVNSSLLYEEDLVLALKNKLEWFQFHFWFWNSDLVLVWFLQNPNQNWRLIVA